MKISHNTKIFFSKICFLLLVSLSFSFAALDITIDDHPNTQIRQGDTKTVVSFSVGGTGSFTKIEVNNSSSAVPFQDSGISKIEVFQGSTSKGSYTFTSSAQSSYTMTFASPTTISGTTLNFTLVYTVASSSQAGDSVYSSVEIANIYDGSTAVAAPSNTTQIQILSAGLAYVSTGFENLLTNSGSNAAPGMINMPIFQFVLRAETVTVNLQKVLISAADLTNELFATSVSNRDSRIKGIMLLLDNGGKEYNGVANETLLAYYSTLPTTNSSKSTVEITIPGGVVIKKAINKDSATDENDKYFYVLYDIGDAYPASGSISCALAGGTGINVETSGTVELVGSFPAGAVTSTLKDVNTIIRSASVNPSGNHTMVIAGQKKVRMIDFTLDNNVQINNATVVIKNSSGSFKPMIDDGVCKVSLYKQEAGSGVIISSTDTFQDVSTCYLNNITLGSGTGLKYYIEYDFGVNASGNVAQCQLGGITSGNAVLGGYVPAPAEGAYVDITPARVWVEFVSANVTSITAKGAVFRVDIGVRNIITDVGQPSLRVYLDSSLCKPKFYSSDIGFGTNKLSGRDLSTEYTCQWFDPGYSAGENPYVDGLFPDPSRIVTLSYTVAADNLASNGYVYVDAQLGYNNNANASDIQKVMYQKYFKGGVLYPAARNYNTKANSYHIINVSGMPKSTATFPSFIKSVSTRINSFTSWRRFVNKDMINSNETMFIQMEPTQVFDSVTLYKNGVLLANSVDYIFDSVSNNITIHDIGSQSGTISFSGVANGITQTAAINFQITSGSKSLSSLNAGPSPFNPDNGPMTIGFNADADCECTIYVYNISGQEMLKEKITAKAGPNTYLYDPVYKSGKKLGRGVYLIRILTDGGKSEVRTKVGVK